MKKLLAVFTLLFCAVLFSPNIHAQGGTVLPTQTLSSVTLPWTLPANCTTTQTCQFQVYSLNAACPSNLATSTGWVLKNTTAAQATQYVDNAVTSGSQVSYDVEAVPNGVTNVFSGPSNCVSVTIPFVPAPPVVGTASAI